MQRAVILLSGGLDSATSLAIARSEGYDCYALSVSYGQRHAAELTAAARVAQALGARRLVGSYVPTKKNGMVRNHYAGLGFTVMQEGADGGSRALLDLTGFVPAETFIHVMEG